MKALEAHSSTIFFTRPHEYLDALVMSFVSLAFPHPTPRHQVFHVHHPEEDLVLKPPVQLLARAPAPVFVVLVAELMLCLQAFGAVSSMLNGRSRAFSRAVRQESLQGRSNVVDVPDPDQLHRSSSFAIFHSHRQQANNERKNNRARVM